MAKIASGANTRVAYSPETVPGTVNTSPQLTSIPTVEFSINRNQATVKSKARQADRMLRWTRAGNVSASGKLVVEYTPKIHDYFLSCMFRNDWVGNVLKVGVKEFSTTFEVAQLDHAVPSFEKAIGFQVNTGEFSNPESDYTMLSLDLLGIDTAVSTAPLDASVELADNIEPFYQGNGVLRVDGAAVGFVTNFTNQLSNAQNTKMVLFKNTARGITSGMVAVTGSFSVTFENLTYVQKFMNNTPVDIEIDYISPTGDKHTHSLPKTRLLTRALPGNTDGVLDEAFTFEALYDDTDANVYSVTRTYI